MQSTWPGSWWDARSSWDKTAIVVWTVVLLFVCGRAFLKPTERTVYPIFSGSAQLWWSGDDLYEPYRPQTVQNGYRYSPAFAVLMTPFAVFPDALGGVLWRLVSTAAFLAALAWFARSVLPASLTRDQLVWLTLLCLPLAVQSLNNGQANVIVIASMLAAVAAVQEERWNVASLLMTLAFVCKVYPLALGLLLIVLYPRQLLWRLSLGVAVSLLLPFVLQNPSYVLDQNGKWIALLRADDRTFTEPENKHRDLWLLIDLGGLPISRRVYTLLQIAGGAGIACMLWIRQRRAWHERALLTSTLALATAWMMTLGPVVESSTFLLLAPSLAWSVLAVLLDRRWTLRQSLLAGSVALFALAVILGGIANTAKLHVSALHPLASLLYFFYLLFEPRPSVEQALSQPISQRAAA